MPLVGPHILGLNIDLGGISRPVHLICVHMMLLVQQPCYHGTDQTENDD